MVDKGATIRPGNTTEDLSSALLLGTGVEDLFGNAFGLSAPTTNLLPHHPSELQT